MPKKKKIDEWPHTYAERVKLTPELLEGFVTLYLFDRFDAPKKTPQLHRELWTLFCDEHPYVAAAAPRGHAKSSAGTLAYGLASVLFGAQDHVMILSATEGIASGHLKNIAMELDDNQGIKSDFNTRLVVQNDTEIIGYVGARVFRIICKGAQQKVRGTIWRNKRPGLILIDDLEDDEAVMNEERRQKLSEWVDNAAIPCLSDYGIVRAVGTIMHFDSWLQRTLEDSAWKTKRFSAHRGYDDFSGILWSEKFSEEKLRFIRQRYINKRNSSGYSQEYLNYPMSEEDSYFRKSDLHPMTVKDHDTPKNFYVGVDLAISKSNRANRTSITVAGIDPNNMMHVVHNKTERLDSLEIIEEFFDIQEKFQPEMWFVEKGQIELTLLPMLTMEMIKRGIFMNIERMPTGGKDKEQRAQAIRARMRAGGVRIDKNADWYDAFEMELLQFPRSASDDRVDSIAWLGVGCDHQQGALSEEEQAEIEWEEEEMATAESNRNETTGY